MLDLDLSSEFIEDGFDDIDDEYGLEKVYEYIKFILNNYFLGKEMYNGEIVDSRILNLEYYTNLIFNTNVCDGIDKSYEIMAENNFKVGEGTASGIPEDVRYVINALKGMKRIVPQEFLGGVLLMQLELIEGLEIW